MPPIMRPALQARSGGRFMEGVRHGINLPTVVVPSFKLGWGSSQAKDGLPKGTRKQAYESFYDLHNRQLSPSPKNATFRFVILHAPLWGGRFQMAVTGERRVTGGNGRKSSGYGSFLAM
jgi:hypothetical protein